MPRLIKQFATRNEFARDQHGPKSKALPYYSSDANWGLATSENFDERIDIQEAYSTVLVAIRLGEKSA